MTPARVRNNTNRCTRPSAFVVAAVCVRNAAMHSAKNANPMKTRKEVSEALGLILARAKRKTTRRTCAFLVLVIPSNPCTHKART